MEGLYKPTLLFQHLLMQSRTTGGNGGSVTTVSTLPQFTAAVDEKNTAPLIVVVKGIITGTANVRIGSNKSVIGLPGSGMFLLYSSIGACGRNGANASVVQVSKALDCTFEDRRM